jgi:hypothetical protein
MNPGIEYVKRSVSAATEKGLRRNTCDMAIIISEKGDDVEGFSWLACLRLKKRERGEVLECDV